MNLKSKANNNQEPETNEISLLLKKLKNFVHSSLFEVIFIDAKGVNCASLETVSAKTYFL